MAGEDAGLEIAAGQDVGPPLWPQGAAAARAGSRKSGNGQSAQGASGKGHAVTRAFPRRNLLDPRALPSVDGARPSPRSIPRVPAISSLDVDACVRLLRTRPEEEMEALVQEHLDRGVPLERVYLDLLSPVARRLGELWEEDRCDYFQVTLLVGRLQAMVRRLGPRFQARRLVNGGRPRSVLLLAPRQEQHTLGLALVGDFFLRAGWSVSMGAPLDPVRRVGVVAREHFDLIGFSVSRSDSLDEVEECVEIARRDSRNPDIRVILGGQLFGGRASTAPALGADSWASDGLDALAVATRLCGER